MLSMFFYFFRDHETLRQEQKGLGGVRMGGEWQMQILRKIPRATSGETQGLPFLLSYVTGFAMESLTQLKSLRDWITSSVSHSRRAPSPLQSLPHINKKFSSILF